MKPFQAAILIGMLFGGLAIDDDLERTDCRGIAEKEDGSISWPSPFSENVECYSDQRVNDSRIASILAFRELIGEFGLDVTMMAMPITWQLETGGPDHPAWEVYIYSAETKKVLMLYLVNAETGLIKKVCDNRFEGQRCK